VSYSSVPPVPQVPSTYTADSKDVTQESSSSKGGFDLENRVLARIDDIIETQLQFHLGQIVWRASESHLDARRFWEEQKKEMFGFAATLVDRMETQVDMQRRMALDSITSPEEKDATQRSAEESDAIMEILQKELKMYKSKYTEAQSQLFELEMLKTRNSELEKQHEIDTISLRKQWEDKDSTLKQLKKLEQERILNGTINSSKKKEPAGSQHTKMFNLETQNKQLKVQVKQMQEINRQLLEEANAYELNIKKQSKELKQIKNQLAEAELVILNNKRKMVPTSSTVTTTTVDGIDCSEDFGKKQQRTKKKDTWADIMESEDEAKKSAKEWAQKYRELQASYFEVCLKLEKKEESSESENKINELNQTIATKNEEIRHLKQAENVNRIQIDYLQLELDKYQRKNKPGMDESKLKNRYMRKNQLPSTKKPMVHQRPSPPPPPQQQRQQVNTKETCYETEDGYLTFTTEINGQLSKYAIKIPSGYQQNSPVVEQKKPAKTKFNPNAQPWPSQSNTSK
jgi:myosin heavy subunit